MQNRVSISLTSFSLFSINSEKPTVGCTEAPSIMKDAVIPYRPCSLEKIPVQCIKAVSSIPYRIIPYLEWRPPQRSEMSFSRETLALSYSAQQFIPFTEILPPSKGVIISFSGGYVYSHKFPAQRAEMSLPSCIFLSLRGQSLYLNECKKYSSPKFEDLLSLRKRPLYLGNLLVQCTEIPSSKRVSTSFSDRSSKMINPPWPVERTDISSLKDDSWLSTRPSHLDKLPIQCSELSSPKDHLLSLSGRSTYCDKFPVQCPEIPSSTCDLLSTNTLLSYLDKFSMHCTEMSTLADDFLSTSVPLSHFDKFSVQCTEMSSPADDFLSTRTLFSYLDKFPIQCTEMSPPVHDFLSINLLPSYLEKFPIQCTEMSPLVHDFLSMNMLPSYLDKFPIQCTEMSSPQSPVHDFLSTSTLPSYLYKFPIQCTETFSPTEY